MTVMNVSAIDEPTRCNNDLLIYKVNKSLLHLVGSYILLYLIDYARTNKNQMLVLLLNP